MALFLPSNPPTPGSLPEWYRKVSTAVNALLGRQGYLGAPSNTAPIDPQPGAIWIDSTDSNRAKVWDGTTFQPLW